MQVVNSHNRFTDAVKNAYSNLRHWYDSRTKPVQPIVTKAVTSKPAIKSKAAPHYITVKAHMRNGKMVKEHKRMVSGSLHNAAYVKKFSAKFKKPTTVTPKKSVATKVTAIKKPAPVVDSERHKILSIDNQKARARISNDFYSTRTKMKGKLSVAQLRRYLSPKTNSYSLA